MAYEFVDTETRTTYLKNRLDMLSKSIQNSASFQTQEAYVIECNRVLAKFYKTISEPFFDYQEAVMDHSLLPSFNSSSNDVFDYDYNLFWQQFLDSLTVLFLEMENLEAVSIANYNFSMVELGDLTARLKSVSSKLGDYILYSGNLLNDVLLVKESFNNLLRIDNGSSLLSEKECQVNQEEGITTLPLIPENNKTISVEESNLTIDSTNGGFAGNNHEIGAVHNGEKIKIIDNNPDTWFEYEKVVDKSSENEPPLVLDMAFNFGEPKIINRIEINPNNFGTRTVCIIERIDTSTDGKVYTSIKDDIPITGYEVEDEENVFTLAPSTSRYAGQGIYTFTPRKAQYVRITLKQNEPYVISTTTGEKLRYAIGIRDILFKSLAFESKGELITSSYTVSDEIKKVILEATQTPIKDSELTNIKYFISHNEGTSWNEIQPKHIGGLSGIESTVPEVINFNTSDSNSINTDSPVTSVKLKIFLEREDGNFVEGASSFAKTILTKSEIHGMPQSSPFSFSLENSPIDGTVEIIDPMFGSMGIPESAYFARYGTESNEDMFLLPAEYKEMEAPWEKVNGEKQLMDVDDWLFVYVGGEKWEHITGEFSDNLDKAVFKLEDTDQGKKLLFSSEVNGVSPPDNASISLHFGPERLYPTEQSDNHLVQLKFKTSKTKEDFKIERYDKIETHTEELPFGSTRINLAQKNIITLSVVGDSSLEEQEFINGQSEFVANNSKDYSIDKKNGVLFFKNSIPVNAVTRVTYTYQPIVVLSPNDWEWTTNSNNDKPRLVIKDSGWKTQEVESMVIDSNSISNNMKFNLNHLGIIAGTVTPVIEPTTSLAFSRPVEFTDGTSANFSGATEEAPQYAIDYKNGEVYLSHPPTGLTSLSFSYSWAEYKAKYRIARNLKKGTDYKVDIPNKSISITDKEFFTYLETSHDTKSGRAGHYLVNYDYVAETRENIEELKDYFTPVVKDFTLKLLRAGGVF